MSLMRSTETAWVVLDGTGRIVVIFGGADAAEAATGWAERGYRVESVAGSEIHAAWSGRAAG
jgi:hypothetical protein